jgi:hypothetical protein
MEEGFYVDLSGFTEGKGIMSTGGELGKNTISGMIFEGDKR